MKLFYLIGQSPQSIVDPQFKTPKYNFIQKMPIFLFIIIAILLLVSSIVLQNFLKCYCREQNGMIANSTIIMEFLANCIVYTQCIRNDGNLNVIWSGNKDIYLIFKENFKCQAHMAIYQNRILWKICPIFMSYGMVIVFFIPWCIVGHNWYIGIHLKGFQFTSIMASAHVLVYIELIYFYLEQLNVAIRGTSTLPSCGTSEFMANDIAFVKMNQYDVAIENLRTFKNVHFRLWKMARDINGFFGWVLASVIIRNFLDASYDIYWAFLVINDHNNHRGTILEMCRK